MGIPTVTWGAAYEGTPAGTDDPRAADDRMREIKLSVRERLEREHGGATSEASDRHGVHRKGSARASYAAGDPSTAPDGTSTRALNSTDDDGRIHIDSSSKKIRAYDGSSWFDVKVENSKGIEDAAGTNVNLKVLDIGDWNMDSTSSVNVAHGLTTSKIVAVQALIRDDAGTSLYAIDHWYSANDTVSGFVYVSGSNITLGRRGATSTFDNTNFDATSYNRGWVLIWYVD